MTAVAEPRCVGPVSGGPAYRATEASYICTTQRSRPPHAVHMVGAVVGCFRAIYSGAVCAALDTAGAGTFVVQPAQAANTRAGKTQRRAEACWRALTFRCGSQRRAPHRSTTTGFDGTAPSLIRVHCLALTEFAALDDGSSGARRRCGRCGRDTEHCGACRTMGASRI